MELTLKPGQKLSINFDTGLPAKARVINFNSESVVAIKINDDNEPKAAEGKPRFIYLMP